MALDPNERPPYGGPTYKTRERIEIIMNFLAGGVLIAAAPVAIPLAGAVFVGTLPVPAGLAVLGVLAIVHGSRKWADFRRRWR